MGDWQSRSLNLEDRSIEPFLFPTRFSSFPLHQRAEGRGALLAMRDDTGAFANLQLRQQRIRHEEAQEEAEA
jgi:hypothetical protein